MTDAAGNPPKLHDFRPSPWGLGWALMAILSVLILGLGFTAVHSFQKQRDKELKSAREQLEAIADLKVAQIENWRNQRANEAALFLRPPAAKNVQGWLAAPTDDNISLDLMGALQRQGQYQRIWLFDSNRTVRRWFGPPARGGRLDSAAMDLAALALHTNQVVFSALHRDSQTGEILLDIATPLNLRSATNQVEHPDEVVGAVVFEINAATFLFPKIQSWPTPSRTAETLIVRREGNEVVFLNELRHRTNTAFLYRKPLTDSNLVSAMALRGQRGILDGSDYRGVPVLASARQIPGRRWMMITKVDQEEILAPLRATLRSFFLVSGLLLALAALTGALVWNDRERRFSLRQLAAQKEFTETLRQYAHRLRSFASATFEGITISENGRLVDVNEQYLHITGYRRHELLGKEIDTLATPDCRALVKDWLRSEQEATYEARIRRKNGTEADVEIRTRITSWEGRTVRISAVRDVTERNRQERELRQSEEWLRQSQRVAQVGSYVLDLQTGIWTGSEMLNEILGLEKSFDRVAGSWQKIVHPDDWLAVQAYSEEVRAEKKQFEKDYRIIRRVDGRERWVLGKGALVYDESGQPVRMHGIIQDITDRKQAEEVIRSSRRRLTEIIEHTPAGYFFIDVTGRFRHVNPAWLGMHGFRVQSEVIGRHYSITLVEDDRAEIDARFARLIGTRANDSGEMRRRLTDGSIAYHFFSITPVYEMGTVIGLEGFLIDATELHLAESRLREREHHYRSLIENSSDLTTIVREDGKLLYLSPSTERLLGYSSEELQGRAALDFIHPDDHAHVVAIIEEAVATPGQIRKVLARCRHKDGSWRILECLGRTHSVRNHRSATLVVNSRDVTERVRLEEQLRQSQKMEAVGRLVGGVAHDFNNILTAVLIHLGLLKDDTEVSPVLAETLAELQKELSRATALTRQLLLFSRQRVAQPLLMDLDASIRDLARMLQRTLGETIRLVIKDAAGMAWVKADPGMMEQIVMNLCINARDAMPQGGCITVATAVVEISAAAAKANGQTHAGRFVCLSVRDTGCGMAPAVLRRLFEPFFTTKEAGKGTGLGLATIHSIVKQHEGWIEVQSTIGEGSIFRVYLPAASKPLAAGAMAPVARAPLGGTETILLVDDDSSIRQVAALWLRRLGYAVFEAGNSAEAVRAWEQHRSEVVLLFTDLVMPGDYNGLELAEHLWQERPDLKVIISSGYKYDDAHSSVRAHSQKMMFLPKPYDAVTLARKVRECFNLSARPSDPS